MELRDETALTNGTGACTVQNGLRHFYHWNSAKKTRRSLLMCWFHHGRLWAVYLVSGLGEVRVFDGAKYFSTKKSNTLASNHQGLLEYSPIKGELIILNKPGSIAPQKTNQRTIINHHLPSCINYIRIFGGGGLNPYYMVIQILS